MMNWKRPRSSEQRNTVASDTGAVLAANVRELINSGGCLMGNLAGLGNDIAQRVAVGTLTEAEAVKLSERISHLIESLETVCKDRVSSFRESLPSLPERPAQHGHGHPH
jgi:hypothetical protein